MSKVRLLMNGCGSMASHSLRIIKPMEAVEVVGFIDINEENARDRATEYDKPSSFIGTDLATAIDQVKPDAVFDCSIPEAHYACTMLALERGCHVLGEKPLADSMAHATEMTKAAQKANRIYAIIQNRRYMENIRRLRRFLESGAIGQITTVNSDFYLAPHFGGFRDAMDHVLLLDMAIHTFDAARYISESNPQSVYCYEWNPTGSWYHHGASAMAIFQMTSSAAHTNTEAPPIIYNYRGSWCAEGIPTTWECEWRIIGDKGCVTWDGGSNFKAEAVVATNTAQGSVNELQPLQIPPCLPIDRIGGHEGVIREFIECIESGRTPETAAADNIKSLAMVFGAIKSADCGQRVTIDL